MLASRLIEDLTQLIALKGDHVVQDWDGNPVLAITFVDKQEALEGQPAHEAPGMYLEF